jgi:hypothetical protein
MQNKPNSLNTEFNATLFATKLYRKNRPDRARKNKPNQTQLVAAKPLAKPDQSQFTRNTPPRPLAGRYATRHTNREPVQSAKMAQEIDPHRTAKRTQRHLTIVPKEIYIPNSESTRQLARALRMTIEGTVMILSQNPSCPRLGPLGLRDFVAKRQMGKEV